MKDSDFLKVIDATPLISIDLIVENDAGHVLLGKRNNRPAQGFWFVPGGRIRKNETLAQAFHRISTTELGIVMPFERASPLGAFDHIYSDNFANADGINTHYVALGYKVRLEKGIEFVSDDQHSDIGWWSLSDMLQSADVHPNTKLYFENAYGRGR